jgi:hypothetical protein
MIVIPDVSELSRVAGEEAAKQSTNKKDDLPPQSVDVALTDKGIHRTQEDVWEEELIAAGWQPCAAHPHAAVWLSPKGEKVPGPGYAHSQMKQVGS